MAEKSAPQPKKLVTLGSKGQITVPREIRERAQLEPGDAFEVDVVPGGILLRQQTPSEQAQDSPWSEEWQEEEQEADTGYDHLPKTDRNFFDSLEI